MGYLALTEFLRGVAGGQWTDEYKCLGYDLYRRWLNEDGTEDWRLWEDESAQCGGVPPTDTATISGQVVQITKLIPIMGANISFLRREDMSIYTVVSGINGEYSITVPFGTYDMTTSKEGYLDTTKYSMNIDKDMDFGYFFNQLEPMGVYAIIAEADPSTVNVETGTPLLTAVSMIKAIAVNQESQPVEAVIFKFENLTDVPPENMPENKVKCGGSCNPVGVGVPRRTIRQLGHPELGYDLHSHPIWSHDYCLVKMVSEYECQHTYPVNVNGNCVYSKDVEQENHECWAGFGVYKVYVIPFTVKIRVKAYAWKSGDTWFYPEKEGVIAPYTDIWITVNWVNPNEHGSSFGWDYSGIEGGFVVNPVMCKGMSP